MQIAYLSITGQVKRFVNKLDFPSYELSDYPSDSHDFVLIVPTYEPEITYPADDFLTDHSEHCLGIIGSGNRNFGDEFVYTAKDLAHDYKLPMLYAFEFSGTEEDVKKVDQLLKNLL